MSLNAGNYSINNRGLSKVDSERLISGDTVALFATPFSFVGGRVGGSAQDGANEMINATPIGAIQGVNFSQFKQTQKFYEVGSSKAYTIDTSKVQGQMNISSIVYNGPNLLAALTAADRRLLEDGKEYSFDQDAGLDSPGYMEKLKNSADEEYTSGMLLNLSSSFFRRPLGLIMVFHDNKDQILAAYFVQEAQITSNGLGINANNPMIAENASITYEKLVPIKVSRT